MRVFKEGDIVTFNQPIREGHDTKIHFNDSNQLQKTILQLAKDYRFDTKTSSIVIRGKVVEIPDTYVDNKPIIMVEWFNPFERGDVELKEIGFNYTMLEEEFVEYKYLTNNNALDIHSIESSQLYHKCQLNKDVEETAVSFQSKPLVANKINNSTEIENFLLIS